MLFSGKWSVYFVFIISTVINYLLCAKFIGKFYLAYKFCKLNTYNKSLGNVFYVIATIQCVLVCFIFSFDWWHWHLSTSIAVLPLKIIENAIVETWYSEITQLRNGISILQMLKKLSKLNVVLLTYVSNQFKSSIYPFENSLYVLCGSVINLQNQEVWHDTCLFRLYK